MTSSGLQGHIPTAIALGSLSAIAMLTVAFKTTMRPRL